MTYGSFFDYDNSQLELVSYTAAYPVPWTGSAAFKEEDDTGWHTVAGWTAKGYTAPGYFEEGSDLLKLVVTSPHILLQCIVQDIIHSFPPNIHSRHQYCLLHWSFNVLLRVQATYMQ